MLKPLVCWLVLAFSLTCSQRSISGEKRSLTFPRGRKQYDDSLNSACETQTTGLVIRCIPP